VHRYERICRQPCTFSELVHQYSLASICQSLSGPENNS
jgi:hypothetical protein